MRGREEVTRAVERLYEEFQGELRGLDTSTLVDDLLAEKDQTIAEFRAALRAQTEVIDRLQKLTGHFRRALPVRILRKLGAIDLVKRSVLRIDSSRRAR